MSSGARVGRVFLGFVQSSYVHHFVYRGYDYLLNGAVLAGMTPGDMNCVSVSGSFGFSGAFRSILREKKELLRLSILTGLEGNILELNTC